MSSFRCHVPDWLGDCKLYFNIPVHWNFLKWNNFWDCVLVADYNQIYENMTFPIF